MREARYQGFDGRCFLGGTVARRSFGTLATLIAAATPATTPAAAAFTVLVGAVARRDRVHCLVRRGGGEGGIGRLGRFPGLRTRRFPGFRPRFARWSARGLTFRRARLASSFAALAVLSRPLRRAR